MGYFDSMKFHVIILEFLSICLIGLPACSRRPTGRVAVPTDTPVLITSEDHCLGIPEGHLPPPGECRIWYPDKPPGQQPPPGPCGLSVPLGAWLLSRPDGPASVRVEEFDAIRKGIIVAVRIYESTTGKLLRRER